MKKNIFTLAACFSVLGMAGSADAYLFKMGDGSSVDGSAFSDPGLVMEYLLVKDLSSLTFDLEVGKSKEFLFAKFWTNENSIEKDDLEEQSLTAHVDFANPDLLADLSGTSVGTEENIPLFKLFGHMIYIPIEGWKITWESPVTLNFGPGGTGAFTLGLSNASFESIFGPDGLFCKSGADVYATVTYTAAPVPEPATALLFGSGIAALAGYRIRRKK